MSPRNRYHGYAAAISRAKSNANYFGVAYVVFCDTAGMWRVSRQSTFTARLPEGSLVISPDAVANERRS